MTRAERHAQVTRLKEAGLTFKEIAAYLGLGKSTVKDVYYDPTGAKARERKRRRHGTCIDCGTNTYNSGSRSVPERCRECEHQRRGSLEHRRGKSAQTRGRITWTDDQIVHALQSAARDGVITTLMYRNAVAAARKPMPSYPLLQKRGWHRLVALAGLTAKRYKTRVDRIPEASILAALEDCRADIGKWPAGREYDAWARNGRGPSFAAAELRFGTWMAAIEAAIAASEPEPVAA